MKDFAAGLALAILLGASTANGCVAQEHKWGEGVNLGHVHKPYSADSNASTTGSQPASTGAFTGSYSAYPTNSGTSSSSAGAFAGSTGASTKTSYPPTAPALNSSSSFGVGNSVTPNDSIAQPATTVAQPAGAPNSRGAKLRNGVKSLGELVRSGAGALSSHGFMPNGTPYGRGTTLAPNQFGLRAPQSDPRDYHVGSGIDSPFNIDRPTHNYQTVQAPTSGAYDPAQNYLTPPKPLHKDAQTTTLGAAGALNFSSSPHSQGPFNNQRSIALNRAGNWSELLDYSRAWVAKDPNTPMGWFGLGQAAYKLGNWDAAVEGFSRTTKLTPTEPKPYNNLSAAYCKRAQFDLAAKATMDGAWYCGKTCSAYDWYVFGNAFKDLRMAEAAEHAYRQALAKRPNFPEAQNNLGVVLYNEGETDSADSWYKKAAKGGNRIGAANHRGIEEARAAAAQAARAAASGGGSYGADLGFYSPSAVAARRHAYQVATSGQGKGYGE